jgi:hypothetical protein
MILRMGSTGARRMYKILDGKRLTFCIRPFGQAAPCSLDLKVRQKIVIHYEEHAVQTGNARVAPQRVVRLQERRKSLSGDY